MTDEPLVVCAVPEGVLESTTTRQEAELLSYVAPDVIITETHYQRAHFVKHDIDCDIYAATNPGQPATVRNHGSQLLITPPGSVSATLTESRTSGHTNAHTYVCAPDLSVELNLTTLESTLAGREQYTELADGLSDAGGHTFLTPTAPPTYRREWDIGTVNGLLPGADETTNQAPTDEIAILKCYADGTVAPETRSVNTFGLQALRNIGRKRAQRLRDAGYETIDTLATADVQTLAQVDGFSRTSARELLHRARAIANETVFRLTDDTLPDYDPVFIDIETDGLSPTVAWLIGVFDSHSDTYMSFITRDPDAPGKAVTAFANWFAANASDRPVVAYNGHNFDFPTLHEQILTHAPEHQAMWEAAHKVDPYWWAVKQENAALPGRTNGIETVADALGWESDETGLTGAVVGQRYQNWYTDPDNNPELNWDKHIAYCEDDVRSLAAVYRKINTADCVTRGRTTGSQSTAQNTQRQGTLGEF